MATQARLPATLPTPAAAKSVLRLARSTLREKRNVAEGLKQRFEAARDELVAAEKVVDEAEADMLANDEGTPGEAAADKQHHQGCVRMERAELDHAKVGSALKLAKGDLKGARIALRVAREDVEAVRQGRRHA